MDATSLREAAIFSAARRLPAEARAFYLDGACAGDALLRRQIEELLQADAAAGAFLPELAAGAEAPVRAGAEPAREATVRTAPSRSEQPGDTIDRYKLMEKVGEGGCGMVYVAEQTQPVRRRVALKVIKLGMDTQQVVARFEAERQALAMMDHPNIAKVLDAGTTQAGRPYFVMELVRGIRITDYCDQANLSTRQRLELFIHVCQAIQHAHQKGIIHRDIKPSNILVTLHDGVPVPKVIDFGIAKATEGRLTDATVYTQLNQFMGTPAYMSPEQAELSGLDIDTRSDIYSLGVLLYELLVGSTPFDAKELMASGLDAMRKTIREQEPVRPSTKLTLDLVAAAVSPRQATAGLAIPTQAEINADSRRRLRLKEQIARVRGDLDWIVMKCLEKDRSRRFETANGLAADLKRHLNNEPVVARPPSTAYRFQKAWRRNKLAFSAGAAVAAALVVGIGISTWQALVATRAKTEAVQAESKAVMAQREAEKSQQAEKQERLQGQHQLYAASMNLAQQAWDENNIGRLLKLLEDTRTSLDRGFEWSYWQRQTHLALKTLRGHRGSILSVAFSLDGQRIVTGSEDNTAKVWEVATGREWSRIESHTAPLNAVAFSPDSQRIVTGSDDRTAKVWEVASGKKLLLLQGHSNPITSVAFSPDGQRIVTGSADNTARVWEAATGREWVRLEDHTAPLTSVAFSPDGQRIVTSSHDRTAKVWAAVTGRELVTLKGHTEGINAVAFSPDGQRIVTGSWDQTARVWDVATGRELLPPLKHSGMITSVAFSPDGQRIITGGVDQTVKVWEAASGQELLPPLKGHSGAITSVAFSPDGQRIVTGSHDQTAKVWAVAPGRELVTFRGHDANIASVAFSRDGKRMVTGGWDRTFKVWEAAGDRALYTVKGHAGTVWAVAFSPDGQQIVTGSDDRTAKVWEAASGRRLATLEGHSDHVWSVAFSPDGRRIVTGSFDQTARMWEAASGRELARLKGHRGRILAVAFSPDGRRIVTGSFDQTARVWEAASGRELARLKGHSKPITSVAFSEDGQRVVTGSDDQSAKVWEAASGQELLTLNGHRAGLTSVGFSPDGQRVVTGSDDQTAKVWELGRGRELLTLKGHSGAIRFVAFSPDGQRIITGSQDQTALVWEAARPAQIASWQEEEQAAARSLDALQRESMAQQERERIARAADEGAIKRWLVLAPIPLATNQSGASGLDSEQIGGEARLRPKAGEGMVLGNGELKWQEVVREDYVIDFNEILGQVTPQSVAYAVCYIRSDVEQQGLRMLVGSDDQAQVYLNGKQVHKSATGRGFLAAQDMVSEITLNKGLNLLVFKVVNETSDWKGSIRFTDAAGQPVQGIRATLTPP